MRSGRRHYVTKAELLARLSGAGGGDSGRPTLAQWAASAPPRRGTGGTSAADLVLPPAGAEVLGRRLLPQEVANALLSGVRRRRWSGADADRAARQLWAMPWRVWEPEGRVADAWELARRYDSHPVHGMVYLATARSARTALVTADERLVALLGSDHLVVVPDAWVPGLG